MAARTHAALADAKHACGSGDAAREADLARLHQLSTASDTAFEHASALNQPGIPLSLHESIEQSLHRALELQYHIGQLAAMPKLLAGYRGHVQPSLPDPARLPGGPQFDPWCLTSPVTRADWQRDPAARRAIDTLWSYDPEPSSTIAVQAQIDEALRAGSIVHATDRDGRPVGNYYCCPWGAIYEVPRPVRIGGRNLRVMEQFAYDVSAEEIAEGGEFARRIEVGPFMPTSTVDYCDPRAGGHRD